MPLGQLPFLRPYYLVEKRTMALASYFCLTHGKQANKTIYISNFYQCNVKCKELQHVDNHDCTILFELKEGATDT